MKRLQVLGTGCHKCAKLAEHTRTAVSELGIEATIEKVTDIDEILQFGPVMTPALAIDGEVKLAGKAATVQEIKQLLS